MNVTRGEVGADRVCIVAFVRKEGIGCPFRQADQRIIRLAICRFTARQQEGDWSSEGISQAVKLTGEPAPRAAKSASMSPPLWMARPLTDPLLFNRHRIV